MQAHFHAWMGGSTANAMAGKAPYSYSRINKEVSIANRGVEPVIRDIAKPFYVAKIGTAFFTAFQVKEGCSCCHH